MECKIIKVLYSNNDYNVAIFKAKNTSDIPKGYSNGADNKFTATGYYPTNQLPLNLSGKRLNMDIATRFLLIKK